MGGIILEFIVFPKILNDYSFNSKFKKYIMYFAASNYLLCIHIIDDIFTFGLSFDSKIGNYRNVEKLCSRAYPL